MRFLIVIPIILMPTTVLAAAACPPNALCLDNPLGAADFKELLNRVLDFAVVLAVPVSVLFTIKGAFQLMTSAGDARRLDEAWTTFKWVFIGLAGVFLSKSLLAALLGLLGV
jgi:hypothetical protein